MRPLYSLVLVSIASVYLSAQQREPVLSQIDLPHAYYYREMYLPQLTTGPSSVAWSPDARSLASSMAGSLWMQPVDSNIAEQLTAGPGYDYQPDWSADGRWIIYASYAKDAIELWAFDLISRQSHQLTRGGAVNVEPRFSPDGRRVAFVSTQYQGHFHIFAGDFADGVLRNVRQITAENRSALPRYYYSQFDHEISPAWSPDGSQILFVSNRGHIYGTGGFWRMKAEPGGEAHEIHYEETAWKARPEFSPDGKRIVYASYLGRQWHQLWAMPAQGGDAFPLSYGDYDNINPRWSPDGKSIAFISNRDGNTSVWIHDAVGGAQHPVTAKTKHYLKPTGQLSITVLDAVGQPTAARLFVVGEDGRAYAPDNAWMRADDNFVRSERAFEAHYFHTTGRTQLSIPAGNAQVGVMKGFEFQFENESVRISPDRVTNLTIRLKAIAIPVETAFRWTSGDVHVHMNYGGAYRDTPQRLVSQAEAENLAIIENLIVNKEQRIPDIAYFSTKPDAASTDKHLLLHGQEFHTSYWGHLGLLHLTENLLIPDYAAYANTAASSLFPSNANVADFAHQQGALVGYVHPLDSVPDPAKDPVLTYELPVDVALGKVDYIEAMGFSDHKATSAVWHRLLNCGFHLPTAAGTDAMANFASLRGPIGLNRVYAKVPAGPLKIDPWLDALKQGRTFATNGPLLGFTLGGRELGDELDLAAAGNVKYKAWLRSIVPVDHLELICNGKVERNLKLSPDRQSSNAEGDITLSHGGWCVLRAWSDQAEYPVLDAYPYATTSPIYVSIRGSKPESSADAAYFVAWIDRLAEAAKSHKDWKTDREKAAVLDQLSRAREVYQRLQN